MDTLTERAPCPTSGSSPAPPAGTLLIVSPGEPCCSCCTSTEASARFCASSSLMRLCSATISSRRPCTWHHGTYYVQTDRDKVRPMTWSTNDSLNTLILIENSDYMFFPLTKQLKSMARTLSRESSRFLDSQEMSHILWDLQVHRRVHGMYREPDE